MLGGSRCRPAPSTPMPHARSLTHPGPPQSQQWPRAGWPLNLSLRPRQPRKLGGFCSEGRSQWAHSGSSASLPPAAHLMLTWCFCAHQRLPQSHPTEQPGRHIARPPPLEETSAQVHPGIIRGTGEIAHLKRTVPAPQEAMTDWWVGPTGWWSGQDRCSGGSRTLVQRSWATATGPDQICVRSPGKGGAGLPQAPPEGCPQPSTAVSQAPEGDGVPAAGCLGRRGLLLDPLWPPTDRNLQSRLTERTHQRQPACASDTFSFYLKTC